VVMRQVALPIATSGRHQYGSFLHGAVWHAIVASNGGWSEALQLCNFTNPMEWSLTTLSCVHGLGHAFLMRVAPIHVTANYSACNQPGWGLRSLPNGTVEAALDACRAGPTLVYAAVCAEGVWEAFIQIGPGPATPYAERFEKPTWPWYAACTLVDSLNAPCFMSAWNQLRAIDKAGRRTDWQTYPARRGHLSDCTSMRAAEHHIRACISGISRWLFYRSSARGVRLVNVTDGSGLVDFCANSFLSARLDDRAGQGRMLSCVAGSMYGIVFGVSREMGLTGGQLTLICTGLLKAWWADGRPTPSRRREAYELCTRFKSSAMPMEEAMDMLPAWFGDHRLLNQS